MIDKKFSRSGGHGDIDFRIDRIRANKGTLISFRDVLPNQAITVTAFLKDEYQKRYNRAIQLKTIKTDNIPMGVRKGQVLVQIGLQDVYNNPEDMESAKHFVHLFRQGDLRWVMEILSLQFPSIDIESLLVLETKV